MIKPPTAIKLASGRSEGRGGNWDLRWERVRGKRGIGV